MANIGDLNTRLTLDQKDFERNLNKARKNSQTFTQKAGDGFSRLNKTLTSLKAAAAGFVAALAVRQVYRGITNAISELDKLGDTAAKIGFSTDALQELRYAGEQVNVAITTTDLALQRFSRRVAEARSGTGELKKVLDDYNISLHDSEGRIKSNEQVLSDLADVIRSVGDEGEQLRIAFKAFDSEGAGFVNVLKGGSDELERFATEARTLGLVVDRQVIAKAGEAGDKLAMMSRVMKTRLTVALADVSPGIINLGNAFAEATPKLIAFFETLFLEQSQWSMTTLKNELEEVNSEIARLEGQWARSSEAFKIGNRDRHEERMIGLYQRVSELHSEIATKEEEAKNAAEERARLARENAEAYQRQVDAINERAEAEEAAARAQAEQEAEIERLDRLAEKWRNLVDPLSDYKNALAELNEAWMSGGLSYEDYLKGLVYIHDKYRETAEAAEELNDGTEDLKKSAADFGAVFTSAFEEAALEGEGLRDVIKGLTDDIIRLLFRQSILDPVASAIGNVDFGSIFKNVSIGKKAGGGTTQGLTLVGERGPELIAPPGPRRVIPQHAMTSGSAGPRSVKIEIVNSGSGKQVDRATQTFDGEKAFVTLFTSDIESGGTVSRKIEQTYGLRRRS